MNSRGISYLLAVLIVLAITLVAIVVFSSAVGFQTQTLAVFSEVEIRKVGESLVIAEFHRPSSTFVVYNNGLVPTCFVEMTLVGGPSFYNNPSCTPIQPGQHQIIPTGLVNPPQKFTVLARTINNKIITYTIS
ncbi:MAG: hypothetical protein RMI43_01860 [Candidatus Caldarchaeum sp.]|nr:hypothetical protein [Candidatus Caldarchaeum sp.]MCS7134172.1 hypothetical protein [Candidatus Caldarchaeum sp.]MCX8201514.1 hypothetical protein [Candidatus Caldarchaeum sp.]MDW8062899.1 hypothetical protein [Candidatus Caldarchaeum sp.]MDW8434929.1 hypothetical protein [Candidatus Caldarchaeum sp.]